MYYLKVAKSDLLLFITNSTIMDREHIACES